jgi:hypothetical protein
MRRLLDQANPKFAAMSSYGLINWFINFEQDGKFKSYPLGERWGGFLPQWTGHMYAHYQWQFNIPSEKIIELLPLDVMERIFPVLHQASWTVAANKIHELTDI